MGFYNFDDGVNLIYGPNFVEGPGFSLQADQHTTYTYPVNGWFWFDTLEEAQAHFGITS